MKIFASLIFLLLTGCAYRTSEPSNPAPVDASNIILSESHIAGKKYKSVGPVQVEIKKLTIFNADPTEEMANDLLRQKAKQMGADAVINVRYDSGMGLTTWGYIEATGIAVRFVNE